MLEYQGRVVKVISKAAHKWKQLATRLHFDFCDIECIDRDCPLHQVDACRQVVGEWLSGKGRKPTSWSTVIEALNEIELSELAEDLKVVLEAAGGRWSYNIYLEIHSITISYTVCCVYFTDVYCVYLARQY